MEDGQDSAAVAAITEKGVLSGKRVGATGKSGPPFEWIENAPKAEELEAFIAADIDANGSAKH